MTTRENILRVPGKPGGATSSRLPASTLLHIAKGHRVATASSNTKRRTVLAISKGSRMPHNILQRASVCINAHQRALCEASAAMFGDVRLVRESGSACETCETLRPQLGASSCIFTCGILGLSNRTWITWHSDQR